MDLPTGIRPLTARGGILPGMSEQQIQEQQMIKMMTSVMESCPGKTVMAGVMGFALGGAFGLFMSSMRYDAPTTLGAGLPGSPTSDLTSLPIRQQLKIGLRDMGKQALSSAKNFGTLGAVYSGTECAIEGFRAKNDLWNSVSAGCMTGGIISYKAGPQAAALGCAGMAAFSTAIDYYMRGEEDERRLPVV
ncbi:mitochondrial import inner membrane translocase subunit Tim22 [Trichodelitschia bisporula]|uniref:Mitochondrial import inner membrane translocase subunit TIM22 n=1 Tax=Trichodelitschia bisporula TaxID=703511 RepID=A0A6G1I4E3_9PEZI|nr:mitochondrial import inner membrane translocase subunit Tim22 [Trichodelitschia bisporula]